MNNKKLMNLSLHSKMRLRKIIKEAVREAKMTEKLRSGDQVSHSDRGTGSILAIKSATPEDKQNYEGRAPFHVGMLLAAVDWDDSGTTETVFDVNDLSLAD